MAPKEAKALGQSENISGINVQLPLIEKCILLSEVVKCLRIIIMYSAEKAFSLGSPIIQRRKK